MLVRLTGLQPLDEQAGSQAGRLPGRPLFCYLTRARLASDTGRIGEDPKGIPNNLMPFIQQVALTRTLTPLS